MRKLIPFLLVFVFQAAHSQNYWLGNGFSDGETITTNSGFFYDDGGPGLYGNNQNWSVEFCSENGNPITLDFSGFRTNNTDTITRAERSSYDYITISYSGDTVYAYNTDTPQFGFTSQSGCMSIDFVSNGDGIVDSGWVAEIYAIPPPFNNDPLDAEELVVGNTCSPSFYTNKGAYNSTGLGSPGCKTYFGGDVWFTLIVPDSGVVKIETFPLTLDYAILDIFSSADGNIQTSERIVCVDDNGVMPAVTLSGPTVTPGERLYIRLFGEQAKTGLFGICATDPTAPVTGYTGPGGVGDSISLDLWLRPDTGVINSLGQIASDGEQVLRWEDQSGNENHLEQLTANNQPQYTGNQINSIYGVLSFDGMGDMMSVETGSGDAPLHWFTVGSFSGNSRQTMLSIGDASNSKTASVGRDGNGDYFSFTTTDHIGPALQTDQDYILHAYHTSDPPYHNLELDGDTEVVGADPQPLETNGAFTLGAAWDDTEPFDGYVAEIIQYRKKLNAAQQIIVNNYLATKYDLVLGTNDFYDFKTTFGFDMAGIGRVNAGNTHTRAESAAILSLGNAEDLDDGEFALFGHDNGDFSNWSSSGVPSGDTNIVKLDRMWRFDIAGDPGTVSVTLRTDQLPLLPPGFESYNILVDTVDNDFSAGATSYGAFELGNELTVNHVRITDGAYLAIAAVRPVLSFVESQGSGPESLESPSIEVRLNYAVSDIVEVDYAVTGGTATQGSDYSLNASTISLNPGELSNFIIPLILEDDIAEVPDEYFDIQISTSTSGITIGAQNIHRYTILNNDLNISVAPESDTISGCATSTSTLIVDPVGTGPFSFSWTPVAGILGDPLEDTIEVKPATTTTYTVEVTDGFSQTATDTVRITVVPTPGQPTVNVTGLTDFCEGGSVLLSAPEGYAGYLWSNGETTREITVTSSGTFSVVVADDYGCESPSSTGVIVNVASVPAAPLVSASDLTSFCDGDSIFLIAEEGVYSDYIWSDLNGIVGSDDTLIVKTSGEYFVSAQTGNGCYSENSDTMSITVFTSPDKPVISPDVAGQGFCAGDSLMLSAPAGFTYLWSSGEVTQDIYAKIEGNYTVQVTDGNGCTAALSDPVFVEEFELPLPPTVSADGPTTFCDGGAVQLSAPEGFAGYQWSSSETTREITVTSSGSFSVVVEDDNGCLSGASNVITTTVNPNPDKPAITPDVAGQGFCAGDSLMLSAPAGYTYLWSNGEVTQDIYAKIEGNYTVQVTDGNGCTSSLSDPVFVEEFELPLPPTVSADGPTTFCDGGSVQLSAPEGFAGYQWSSSETTREITVTSSGTYSVVVEDDNGCLSGASNVIATTVNPNPDKPVITPGGDIYLITGQSIELSSSAADAYLWSPGGEITREITVNSTGIYTVIVENEFNCPSEASDPVNVTVSDNLPAPTVSLSGEATFCSGESAILTGESGFAVYRWSDGSTGQELVVTESGSYTLIVEDGDGNESVPSDPVIVTVNDNPVLSVSDLIEPLCNADENGRITVAATGGSAPYSFDWTGYDADESLLNIGAGTYSVAVTDDNDCSGSIEVTLPEPEEISVVEEITPADCPDIDNGAIQLTASGGSGGYAYTWTGGESSSLLTNLFAGTYSYTVSDENNCEFSKSVTVDYLNEICFTIPEIITPNGDTYNDSWYIEGLEAYPNVVIEVFDRWGKRVFYSEGHDIYFDGKLNGRDLPMASYHYVIDLGDGSERIIGNITIIR